MSTTRRRTRRTCHGRFRRSHQWSARRAILDDSGVDAGPRGVSVDDHGIAVTSGRATQSRRAMNDQQLTELLEDKGVKILEVDAGSNFVGLSGYAEGMEIPVIAVFKAWAGFPKTESPRRPSTYCRKPR